MPAEWLVDAAIGETRAALIADERILLAQVERDGDPLRIGAICDARVTELDRARGRAVLVLDAPGQPLAHLQHPDKALTSGARLRVRVTRTALAEAGRVKPARAVLAPPDAVIADGPDLLTRLAASGVAVRAVSSAALDDAGWDALEEAARSGIWPFPGGQLLLCPTPAMLVIDVDGDLAAEPLALTAAAAAGQAIAALDIGGPVGIDFPTLAGRSARAAVGAALDAALAHPALAACGGQGGGHERTALNGFGFLQLVRPRLRVSLIDRYQLERDRADALTLLRRAQRAVGTGPLTLTGRAGVAAQLSARHDWLAALERAMGRPVMVKQDANIAGAGHAQ